MTSLLCRLFVKNRENTDSPAVRSAYGTMVSIVGIVLNLLLSAVKFFAGVFSGSIAVTADAVNNLSDAGSQIISLFSFKISAKPADRDHPFGHARIEYVASMIVSFLILHIGLDLLVDSIRKIFSPEPTRFGVLPAVILGLSVVVKLWIALFNRTVAKKIDSQVMRATAADSLSDAIATSAVLASMLVAHFFGIETDAYMGVVVAGIILMAGVRILLETKNSILGSPPDPKVVASLTELTKEYPEILGIHDLVIHNYGSGNTIASLHAEVDGKEDVFHTHDVIDNIEKRVFSELSVRLTVHMDPIVTDDERVNALRLIASETVKSIDPSLNIHDFRFVEGTTHSNLLFDVSVPFEYTQSDRALKEEIQSRISEQNPNYFVVITIDRE